MTSCPFSCITNALLSAQYLSGCLQIGRLHNQILGLFFYFIFLVRGYIIHAAHYIAEITGTEPPPPTAPQKKNRKKLAILPYFTKQSIAAGFYEIVRTQVPNQLYNLGKIFNSSTLFTMQGASLSIDKA